MKKSITKEQIINTALELMRDKNDLSSLNLREIARLLGCAHTNLYNYFPSYNDLLWETHAALQDVFTKLLTEKLGLKSEIESRLFLFFKIIVDIYIDNKGWFRLAWHEIIGGERSVRDIKAVEKVNNMLVQDLYNLWKELTGKSPKIENVRRGLHNTHCYIVGEISNYLSGRGLIHDEAKFRSYVANEACIICKQYFTEEVV